MIVIRFSSVYAKRRAMEYLIDRCSFKIWKTGEMLLPEHFVKGLKRKKIPFEVVGPPTYEQLAPSLRNPPASAV